MLDRRMSIQKTRRSKPNKSEEGSENIGKTTGATESYEERQTGEESIARDTKG